MTTGSMKWEIKTELRSKKQELSTDEIVDILLKNRGILAKKEKDDFLSPKLGDVTANSVGIDKKQLTKAVKRIQKAIEAKEQIVVFGDYDVDGICASAILWETLHSKVASVMPYIPHRVDEGYGLSIKGIENLRLHLPGVKLIITVDNGIVANEAVEFAKTEGIDVIITDHHLPHEDESHKLPDAFAIVHTTKLCGAGIAWILATEFLGNDETLLKIHLTDHLVFAALATVADMVPLVDSNRAIVKYGLVELRKTTRIGLKEMFAEAGVEQATLETYQIGHMIAPRLNASGRMESAMDSLRLLCTRDVKRARELARLLGEINKLRQEETKLAAEHAINEVKNQKLKVKNLLFVAHETYQQGIIGLVAGKLVEKYYRPSIVLSIGETHSKASVRSVKGFNIIEFLRVHSEHFVNVGGHPMAAGFTVETSKITLLQKVLEEAAGKVLTDDNLQRSLTVDCELPFAAISQELYDSVQALSPFGIGNPEPVFSSKAVVRDIRIMGREGKHLKLRLSSSDQSLKTNDQIEEAVGFGMGERAGELKVGDKVDIAYVIDENVWNGRSSMQLKLKDIVPITR